MPEKISHILNLPNVLIFKKSKEPKPFPFYLHALNSRPKKSTICIGSYIKIEFNSSPL
jgi:hypothetical protein